jgi:hypothetical protein
MYSPALPYVLCICTVCALYVHCCSPLDAALVCASGGDTVRFFRVLDSEVHIKPELTQTELLSSPSRYCCVVLIVSILHETVSPRVLQLQLLVTISQLQHVQRCSVVLAVTRTRHTKDTITDAAVAVLCYHYH